MENMLCKDDCISFWKPLFEEFLQKSNLANIWVPRKKPLNFKSFGVLLPKYTSTQKFCKNISEVPLK